MCRASCCWSSYSLIAELYVAGFLPSFGYPSVPPGSLHSWLVSVIEATNVATMFDSCCHWWRYWRLMVQMEYWGTPLIIKKLLMYPKWMQSRMNRRSPGCAGCLSGPVALGNRLLPLLISKRTREGACTITSISNPNSSMMLKTTSFGIAHKNRLCTIHFGLVLTKQITLPMVCQPLVPFLVQLWKYFLLNGFAPLSNAPAC